MKRFGFIICLTPSHIRSGPRIALFELCMKALKAQTYPHWEAFLLGEEARQDGNLFYIRTQETSKNEKIVEFLKILKIQGKTFDYLIRLDDDDIISPSYLTSISHLDEYDCFYDQYHTYIDSPYLCLSLKKNNWIANTAAHKFEHAIMPYGPENIPLIAQDHSICWHLYYKNKRIFKSSRNEPIYYRVLSPYTITSGVEKERKDINWTNYLKYRRGYGPWISLSPVFDYYNDLQYISSRFFSTRPAKPFLDRFLNYLKYVFQRIIRL